MYEVMMIVGPEMATGFQLAGVRVHEASDRAEVTEALRFALESSNKVGLCVVDEKLLAEVSERLQLQCEDSAIPLVLPLPLGENADPEAQGEAVQEMVRSAIGFTIKLD